MLLDKKKYLLDGSTLTVTDLNAIISEGMEIGLTEVAW
jgi:hypothetical protein